MIGLLTIAGIISLALCKKRGVSGIGAVKKAKRRIYQEIEIAQQSNVDFTLPYAEQSSRAKKAISTLSDRHNASKRVPISDDKYYKQLRRAYNAISGIGQTTLPYRESQIHNHRGDTILIYRDYGSDTDVFNDAKDYVIETYAQRSEDQIGFYETLAYIADGGKFVWESKGNSRGVEKLLFGKKAPGERKLRKSYLASATNGAQYPELFAESLRGYYGDDQEILNGVLECIMQVNSVQQAKNMILDLYERDHQVTEENLAPF